jgi:hypothetical protein
MTATGARVISGKRLVQTATELIAPRLVEFATACGKTLARAQLVSAIAAGSVESLPG